MDPDGLPPLIRGSCADARLRRLPLSWFFLVLLRMLFWPFCGGGCGCTHLTRLRVPVLEPVVGSEICGIDPAQTTPGWVDVHNPVMG